MRPIQLEGWTFGVHAQERMVEMAVTAQEVLEAVRRPDVDYSTPRYGEDARNAKKGTITVAYNARTKFIITILWNTQDQYTRKGK